MDLYSEKARRQHFYVTLYALRGVVALAVLFAYMQDGLEEVFSGLALNHIFNGSVAVIFFNALSIGVECLLKMNNHNVCATE